MFIKYRSKSSGHEVTSISKIITDLLQKNIGDSLISMQIHVKLNENDLIKGFNQFVHKNK